jgi:hypothetical protein
MAVLGLTVALIAGASGLAVAYFTSTGNGTGQAQVGTESPVLINQIGGTPIYNSRIDAAAYQASQCFYCVGMTQLGNKITFAGDAGGPLNDVTVDMANFGTTSGPMNITFNIYAPDGTVQGPLLATDEQSFNIPAAPDGGYGSTYCTTGPGANNPYCGIGNFSITFDFSSQNITLPATVVYGIQYNDAQNGVNGGVNVQVDNEASDISVGSDTNPGNLFAQTNDGTNWDTGGPTGEITCSPIIPGFSEYSTTATSACGAAPYIPAVEFDSGGFSDLYPAGPSQPINFSLTNPGKTTATVANVTIAVASDSAVGPNQGDVEAIPGDPASDIAGCLASWFTVTPSPVVVNQTLNPGQTIDWNGAASISMSNPAVSQDACQGAAIGLTFTSD